MNRLERIISSLYRAMKPVSWVANSIGLVALAGMMFLITADVAMRKAANMPILGSYEVVQFMMILCGGFGLAHCAIEKGHVSVDLVVTRLSSRVRGALGIFTGFLGLAAGIALSWQAVNYIFILKESNQSTSVLMIPMYPFVALFAVGCAFYAVILFIEFLEFLKQGMTK